MQVTVHVWRQESPTDEGGFESHVVRDLNPDMSFLEMMDLLNTQLTDAGREPVAFDHDCREGICGSCAMVINGTPHGREARAES